MKKEQNPAINFTVDKKESALFLPGIPIVLIIFLFTPVKPVQFICLFYMLLVTGSKAYSEYLFRHLKIIRCDKELRVFRHEWLKVELRAENSGRLPAFLHFAEDESGGIAVFRNIKHLFTLEGLSSKFFFWEALCSSRGVFKLGPAVLSGSDPLGLFPFRLISDETTKLFVYPAPAFAALKSPGGIALGNLITADPFSEDTTRPRSLRDYQAGDDSRRINWKASAKFSGKPFSSFLVNEYELSLSYPLLIFLNVDYEEYPLKSRTAHVERVIEAAAAICLMAAREKQNLGIILHTAAQRNRLNEIDTDSINPAAFAMIPVLERLAALEPFKYHTEQSSKKDGLKPSTVRLLEKGKSMPFGTRIIYTGPSLNEIDYNALETLGKKRITLEFLIMDENYLSFSGKGKTKKYQIRENSYEII